MEIALQLLLFFIRNLHPRYLKQGKENVALAGIYQLFPGFSFGEEKHCYLYVAKLSDIWIMRKALSERMTILASKDCELSGDELEDVPCRVIFVDGCYGVPYLMNRMTEIFRFLSAWDKNMHIAALEGKSIQQLLDLSEEMIQYPTIIFDAGFDVLAYSKTVSTEYAKFQEIIRKAVQFVEKLIINHYFRNSRNHSFFDSCCFQSLF